MQKGIASFLSLFLGVVLIVLIVFLFINKSNPNNNQTVLQSSPSVLHPSPLLVSKSKVYVNSDLGFQFKYSDNLTVSQDSEDMYAARNGGDARKNFKGYVLYEPAKFISAVSVLDSSKSFDKAPFSVWVFDNSSNFTPDQFFDKYWYYPFLWGQFNPPEKRPIGLLNQATVSGQLVMYGSVSYQVGSPRYFYIPAKDKMILIRELTTDKTGEDILNSFKLL